MCQPTDRPNATSVLHRSPTIIVVSGLSEYSFITSIARSRLGFPTMASGARSAAYATSEAHTTTQSHRRKKMAQAYEVCARGQIRGLGECV